MLQVDLLPVRIYSLLVSYPGNPHRTQHHFHLALYCHLTMVLSSHTALNQVVPGNMRELKQYISQRLQDAPVPVVDLVKPVGLHFVVHEFFSPVTHWKRDRFVWGGKGCIWPPFEPTKYNFSSPDTTLSRIQPFYHLFF
jgi:hypothetical protein